MLKKLVLSLTLISALCNNTYAEYYLPEKNITLEQIQQTKPSDIIVAWDIHGPLAVSNMSSIAKFITIAKLAPKELAQATAQMVWGLITGKTNPALQAYNDSKAISKKLGGDAHEAYILMLEKHGFHNLAKTVEEISNAYKPRAGIEELVKKLKAAGITQIFASNIGPRLLERMKTSFNETYQNSSLAQIEPGKIVNYSQFGPMPDQTIPADQTTVGKPHLDYFKQLQETYNPNNNKLMIFVDDKLKHAQEATNANIVGVHFDEKSNDPVALFEKDLTTFKIIN